MKKTNKFLSIFLCLALIMSIIPVGYISASAETSFSGGDGLSEATAYQISTEADLIALATAVNGGENFYGKFFKQTADIDVTDFNPIGICDSSTFPYKFYSFKGTYDGDNYKINGSIGAKEKDYQALFGYVGENSTIKNVINNATVNGNKNVGGIVGQNSEGTIINCYNTGNVTGNYFYVGGIVGYNYGSIKDCYNTGSITGNADYVGGVTGKSFDVNAKITNCYNTGNIIGKYYVGGVAGNNSNTIEICYNTGVITGNKYVGGIVGENNNSNDGEITNCYNAASVIGTSQYMGVVGRNSNGTITNCYYDSDKCSATDTNAIGKTTAETSTQEFVDLLNGNGGTAFSYYENFAYNYYPYLTVFGASSAQIASVKEQTNFSKGDGTEANPFLIENLADLENLAQIVNSGDDCKDLFFKQTADITVTDFEPIGWHYQDKNNYNNYRYYSFNGTYDGDNNEINGTIGAKSKNYQASFGAVGSNGTIKNVINNADVKGDWYVGGVVGYNDNGTIENCQNNGAITGTGYYVGGVVAVNKGKIINCCNKADITCKLGYNLGGVVGNSFGTVEYCYNTGDIKTTSGDSFGGVAGVAGTIKNCYNTGNITISYGDKVGGVAGCVGVLIENCYNTGTVSSETNMIGGVVGYSVDIMQNCYNTGDVIGNSMVGGLAGNGRSTKNCYNLGTICGSGAVGGILGANADTIENCYNAGSVTDLFDYNFAISAGGQYAKILNSYFNNEVYTAEDDTDGVTGKTTLEMSTQDFVDLLNGEGEKMFSYKPDDEDNIYYPYLTSFGEDSAVVSKEKVEYPITEGDNQKVEIGTDGTISFTSEGEFGKFKALYLGDEIKKENLVAETNYTAVKGSTKITLNADYVKTLPLGAKTFTLEFVDGYSVVNLEVIPQPVVEDDRTDDTDKPTTDDTNKPVDDDTENPKTNSNSNFAFISILALISVAGAYGVKKKLSK